MILSRHCNGFTCLNFDRISFGFNNDRTIVAIRKSEENRGFKLTKSCTFSDKKTFEFISNTLKLDNSVENEFKIINNNNFYTLEFMDDPMTNDEVVEALEEESVTNSEDELELTPSEDVNNQTW